MVVADGTCGRWSGSLAGAHEKPRREHGAVSTRNGYRPRVAAALKRIGVGWCGGWAGGVPRLLRSRVGG